MSTITLYGATGTIGSRVLEEALRRGHTLTAVVRDPAKMTVTHPRLTVVAGDVTDAASVAEHAQGADVVVCAVGGGDGPGHQALIKPSFEALVAGLRTLGTNAPRLVTVGGAGSLRVADGKRVWDAEGLPEFLLQIMHAHGDALDFLRTVTDVQWTNLSPAGTIAPGERTGEYRESLEDLITDADGQSRISTEDYAVALVDEIEEPKHIGERFTVAY
ncbi:MULTISPECIES: NAD(P)-dependent oxidoreductase [unclassified Streptomyces]|uniref:NAD(P)-dependent oxidoreductase n=1 Tax=unclassified Streptomyces TaxID=2593676 RepID=UPI0004C20D4C|nr:MULTISPECIES: NAD(P)H-binding protein [unclassified Streptomyces]KOX11551.1 3-beta hydroxysteroid dehydrogenase [Streptomyces sp. NRRL B-3648]